MGQGQVGKTSLVSLFVTSEHIHTFDASLGELVNIHFNNNKARMSYSCERLVFHGFNAYPWIAFRYNDASRLGRYDVRLM